MAGGLLGLLGGGSLATTAPGGGAIVIAGKIPSVAVAGWECYVYKIVPQAGCLLCLLIARNLMALTFNRPLVFPVASLQRLVLAVGLVLLGLVLAGCTKQAPPVVTSTEPPKSPEQESFDQIVDFMRHMLIEPSTSRPANVQRFTANSSNPAIGNAEGVLTYELKLEASPEVIAPTHPDEPYRGQIEVTMVTSYSRIERRVPEPETKEPEKSPLNANAIDEVIQNPDLQVEPLDAEQILEQGGFSRDAVKKPSGTVVLDPKEYTVVFDLEYVDGKWQLVGDEIDTTLRSVNDTLEAALKRQ